MFKKNTKTGVRTIVVSVAMVFCGMLDAATTILAATDVGPVKSTDGGGTWQIIPVTVNSGLLSGQPGTIAVAVDPRTPTTWYTWGTTSGTYGFYKTADSGQTWSGTPLLGFHPIGGITIDPVVTGTMYMVGTSNNVANFIVKSTDFGATWTTIQLPATTQFPSTSFPNGASVQVLASDPRISGIVYAAAGNYLFKSTDFGATWMLLSSGVGSQEGKNQVGGIAGGFPSIARINVDPRNSQVVYVSAGSTSVGPNCKVTPGSGECGLYKSTDGGFTWTPLSILSPGVYSLSIDPSSGAIYAAPRLRESVRRSQKAETQASIGRRSGTTSAPAVRTCAWTRTIRIPSTRFLTWVSAPAATPTFAPRTEAPRGPRSTRRICVR